MDQPAGVRASIRSDTGELRAATAVSVGPIGPTLPSPWADRSHTPLEEELRGELNLARRSGVAGREARVADHAERRAADRRDASGLTEVRLVEQVENLDPQLDARAARQRDVLDHREIGVAE